MGQKCAGPLQLRVKSVLVQRPDQSRSSVSIQRSAGFHGRTKPTIDARICRWTRRHARRPDLRPRRTSRRFSCAALLRTESSRGPTAAPSRSRRRRGSRRLRLRRTTRTRWVNDGARRVWLQGHRVQARRQRLGRRERHLRGRIEWRRGSATGFASRLHRVRSTRRVFFWVRVCPGWENRRGDLSDLRMILFPFLFYPEIT
jgi:hypothetical protein